MKKMGWDRPGPGGIGELFKRAGIDRDMPVVNEAQYADTMNSHRLAWYATSVSAEKGEQMWRALSRRYFQGKDTAVRPIRLDSRAMLLECAQEVGLDVAEAERVLDGQDHRAGIEAVVRKMHRAGINAIPVLVFEVQGVAQGDWMQDPRAKSDAAHGQVDHPSLRGRVIHHGSGSAEAFIDVFRQLHRESSSNL